MGNRNVEHVFSEKEQKLRKHWLVSAICIFFIYPFLEFVGLAILAFINPEIPHLLYEQVGWCIREIIPFFLIYFFAYRRPGTIFLAIMLVESLVLYSIHIPELFRSEVKLWNLPHLVPSLVLFVWYYIMSLKLWSMNKKIKARLRLVQA